MKKYAIRLKQLSNSGKKEYGIVNVAIIILEKQEIIPGITPEVKYVGNIPHNFTIMEISHPLEEFPSKIHDFWRIYNKVKYDSLFKIPQHNIGLLHDEIFADLFSTLELNLEDKTKRNLEEKENSEKARNLAQAVLDDVNKGFRVWVQLQNGEKAVVDSKKLMIYGAVTAPLYKKGEHAEGDYKKRIRPTKDLLWIGVKKRKFQKRIESGPAPV